MKATLEFDLPQDHDLFMHSQRALTYAIILDEMDQWLRGLCDCDSAPMTAHDVREKLWRICKEEGISNFRGEE